MHSSSYGRIVRSVGAILLCAVLLHPGSVFSQSDKLDPILKRFAASSSPEAISAFNVLVKTSGNGPVTDVFIITNDGSSSFTTNGVVVKTARGSVVIASVPLSRLEDLAAEPNLAPVNLWYG